MNWLCKKQGAVSHSSTEAEIIALDMGLRMEGIPALDLRDTIIDVLEPVEKGTQAAQTPVTVEKVDPVFKTLLDVDFVPPNVAESSGRGKIIFLEDIFLHCAISICQLCIHPTKMPTHILSM